jgi:hypothetical protein
MLGPLGGISSGRTKIVWSLTKAVVAARSLDVVAELGVAGEVGEEATSAADLASRCGVDADELERVMRPLSRSLKTSR